MAQGHSFRFGTAGCGKHGVRYKDTLRSAGDGKAFGEVRKAVACGGGHTLCAGRRSCGYPLHP